MSKIKDIISLIKELKKHGVIGSEKKKTKDKKKKKKDDKDKIKKELVKKEKYRFFPRQHETPFRTPSDHMHQMIASRGSNPHETPEFIRAQKEINDLRFDNQRKEAKLKELEDSYKDFSEHTTEAVEYLLDDKTKYKPMRFSNVSNTMGPENIEQPENEMGEIVNEHYDDDGNHGDYQDDDEQYDEDENHGDEHHGDYQYDDKNNDEKYHDEHDDDDDSFTEQEKREIEEADRIYNERLKKFQEDQKRKNEEDQKRIDESQKQETQQEVLQDQPVEEQAQEIQQEELQDQAIVGERNQSIFAPEEQEDEDYEDDYDIQMRLQEEEADRIFKEKMAILQQGQPQQKTITPQTDQYFDDDVSESPDPNEDPFTDTASLIEGGW
jgi:hypothetical protein